MQKCDAHARAQVSVCKAQQGARTGASPVIFPVIRVSLLSESCMREAASVVHETVGSNGTMNTARVRNCQKPEEYRGHANVDHRADRP